MNPGAPRKQVRERRAGLETAPAGLASGGHVVALRVTKGGLGSRGLPIYWTVTETL